jgi:predicted flap endonuclease-1-like 5' DNA nuclease
MAQAVRQTLDDEHTRLATDTAAFRGDLRADNAAMASDLQESLDQDRKALFETTTSFLDSVRSAQDVMAQAVRQTLDDEHTRLATDTAAFRGDLRADNAGAGEAWRMVKMLMAQAEQQATVEFSSPSALAELPPTPVAPELAQPAVVAPPEPEPQAMDPLVDIVGIGPVTQEKFYAAGIQTFAQLAAADPDMLREIIGAMTARRSNVEDWIEEARQRMIGGS